MLFALSISKANNRKIPMPPKSSQSYLAILLAATTWFVITESWETAATGVFLYGGILAPISFLIQKALLPLHLGSVLTSLHAFAATWIFACLLFFVRKLAPAGEAVFDVSLLIVAWFACCYLTRTNLTSTIKKIICSIRKISQSKWDHLYCFILLPLLFFFVRVGNEVIDGDRVLYYGQLYIDFGVLKGITNLLVASTFLPEDLVFGTGPLSYHWLFFAVPAWHSDLFGGEHDMNGVLSLANFLAAIFFYKSFSHMIAILLRQVARIKKGAWAGVGAIVAIFGLNIRYFHETAFAITGWKLIDPGTRNRLILSFPNSLNAFGYNTFALGLLVIAIISIHYWNKSANRSHLFLASFWVAWMPIFSATIVPGVAFGIAMACLLKQVRSPWYSLATFAAFGATSMIIFKSLGVFSSQSAPPKLAFDGGQFLINCLFSSPLFLLIFALRKHTNHRSLAFACLFVGLGAMFFPSIIILGSALTPSDISMKNYSVIATMFGAVAVPAISLTTSRSAYENFKVRKLKTIVLFLIGLGFINSLAYAMSSVIMMFAYNAGPLAKVRSPNYVSLPLNYFQSLQYAREISESSDVILAKPFPLIRDPVTIVSERRTLLSNDFFLKHSLDTVYADLNDRRRRWSEWEQSGFADEKLAKWFSDRADILIIEGTTASDHWRPKREFGSWKVYKKTGESAFGAVESDYTGPK